MQKKRAARLEKGKRKTYVFLCGLHNFHRPGFWMVQPNKFTIYFYNRSSYTEVPLSSTPVLFFRAGERQQ